MSPVQGQMEGSAAAPGRGVVAVQRWAVRIENAFLCVTLAGLVLLPLLEMVLRKLSLPGISGTSAFEQHLTLILGMLGGAVAAREGRLLSLSTAAAFFKPPWKEVATVFSHGTAAAISTLLLLASTRFLNISRTEEADKILAYGIPYWVFLVFLPLGFALVALRLLWKSSDCWKGRCVSLGLAAAICWVGIASPWEPERLMWPGLALVLLATALGAPIFAAIGGATLVLLWGSYSPVAAIPVKHYSLVTDAALPAIPLFTLAGYLLAEGGASQRLVRVFQAVVGHIRGGPAIVTTLVCAYFTAFTGASGVTILALGGLLMPVLLAARYTQRDSLGLLTAAGSLGVLLPPCLPLILYSVVAGRVMANMSVKSMEAGSLTMEKMFLGGVLPGLFLVALLAWFGIRRGPRTGSTTEKFTWAETRQAIWDAKWELLLPVIALVALFGGFATPIQAAALTAFYAFFVETVVYRDLHITRAVPKVMTDCGLLVGGVLLILGMAIGFTNYLVTEQVPNRLVDLVQARIHSPWLFLLTLNVVLIVVGCIMDIFSAIVVVVPLIVPLGAAFGIDPVHLGIIFLANLQLGYLTPPVGMNLFLASYRFNLPLMEVVRASLPMFFILLLGVLVITYIPALSTYLPGLVK